ncbi:uncharacterized protein LOC108598949 isoform X1 [Drosophila busckii]|uniref:uncharacterized protein LOC108598949 isoform X1 n=1 Tax=Drosophila busckii TaxID=30019 RepID=UPI00083EFC90|nr:uncharacterized protein LOC108598949 isoform X1 [Drosophila busckii]
MSTRAKKKQKPSITDFDYDPLVLDENVAVKNEDVPELVPASDLEDEFLGLVDSQKLVEDQQSMQRLFHMDMGMNDQHKISERLSSLERKVEFLLNVNTKILTRVDKICEHLRPLPPQNEFPIKCMEELEEIDVKVSNNPERYAQLFQSLLNPLGISKHLGRIFDKSLLMQMNYGGFCSKTALSDYVNLNAALFAESQKKEGYTFDDYKKEVRLAFQKTKNRVYKAKCDAKTKMRLREEKSINKSLP